MTRLDYLNSLAKFTKDCSNNFNNHDIILENLLIHYKNGLKEVFEDSTFPKDIAKSFSTLYYTVVKPSLINEKSIIDVESFSINYINYIIKIISDTSDIIKELNMYLNRDLVINLGASLIALYLIDINEYPYI